VLFVMLSLVMGRSIFEHTKVNSAEMCHPDGYSLQIIDDSASKTVLTSTKAVNDQYFRSFIDSLSAHVLSKFEGAPPCQRQADSESRINLVFVRLPLVTSGDEPIAPPPLLPQSLSGDGCRLDSPWVKLLIHPTDGVKVDAVFIWNERQFLLDQLLLSEKHDPSPSSLMSIPNSLFEQYAQEYAAAEISHSPKSSRSDVNLAGRIPEDILWLFRHAWQSTRGRFSGIARSAMKATLEKSGDGYTRFVMTLFDQCFVCQVEEQQYANILDVVDVIPLEEYLLPSPDRRTT
jgi:hypothetical protein